MRRMSATPDSADWFDQEGIHFHFYVVRDSNIEYSTQEYWKPGSHQGITRPEFFGNE
jgi:hypothetical protein